MTTEQQLTEAFIESKKQLKSYILRITANVEDTEDIVQDTFIKAKEKLAQFKGDSSLKTWIFAIASNLAKDNLRARHRWPEQVTDICKEAALNNPDFFSEAMEIRMHSPQGAFEIREHIAFCFTCIAKSLSIEQHLTLLLKDIYGFSLDEMVQILEFNLPMVKYHLHHARQKMNGIFENRCALINKKGICHQCSELNGIFNPRQNQQEALLKISLVKEADNPDKAHLLQLRTQILSEIDPFESAAATLQLHHLEHNRKVMEKYSEKNGL